MFFYLFWIAVASAAIYTLLAFITRNAAIAVGTVIVLAFLAMGSISEPQSSLVTAGSVAGNMSTTIMRVLSAVAIGLGVLAGVSATKLLGASRA